MKVSIQPASDGSWWIIDGPMQHGPFRCLLDASATVIQMVADRSFAKHGHKVYFLEARFK